LSVVLFFSGLCGLIAVVHPAWFRALANQGGQWIDTSRLVQWLDVRFDVDRYALRCPRAFAVTRERNGQEFSIKYKGKVRGDTIKGKTELERNGEKQSRDWKAKREKQMIGTNRPRLPHVSMDGPLPDFSLPN
jgi:hypothetical protein